MIGRKKKDKSEKSIRATFTLPPEMVKKLEKLKNYSGYSKSKMTQIALSEYFKQFKF